MLECHRIYTQNLPAVIDAQKQIAQAQVDQQVKQITGPDEPSQQELVNKDYEANMMDKKIELERLKAGKKPTKKTVAAEARELNLRYIGEGKYIDTSGNLSHINENGRLVKLPK